MKNIFYILLLLPTIIFAQYPSNSGQKISLGEQTTADGLVFRGVANDTNVITPFSDTSAYIILDTVNSKFYHYNRTTTFWSLAGGGGDSGGVTSFSAGTTGLTPSTATTGAVTLGGTLAVANGGTGTDMSSLPNNYLVRKNSSGVFDTSAIYEAGGKVGIGTNNPGSNLQVGISNSTTNEVLRIGISYSVNNEERGILSWHDNGGITGKIFTTFNGVDMTKMHFGGLYNNAYNQGINLTIQGNGNVGIGTTTPTEKLHVSGNARISAMSGINDIGADANGVLQAATSDMNLKNTIENSPFGLNEILLLNPVTFLYNDENRKIDSDVKEVGFIAQDVFDIIPNAVSSTGTGDLQLDYRAITATLVKAIQEQNLLIKALEQRLLILENK